MKPTLSIATATLLALALAGCASDSATQEPASTVTTSSDFPTTTEARKQFAPGDPSLTPIDAVHLTGLFEERDSTSEKRYWVCNGGEYTIADGAPVESGTCEGPLSLTDGNALNNQWGAVFEKMAEEAGLDPDTAPPADTSKPGPSSGEIQTAYGCEEGYITDPELCAAVGVPLE